MPKRSITETRLINRIVPALLAWFAEHARDLPWRRTKDPYAIFISELMLQQTQVKTVIPYFERWLRALPDFPALAKARPERVLKLWEGLGYYSRARNAHAAARLVVEQHGGRLPEIFEHVLALPGVGRYTAGAVCSIAFNQPAPILDGNVMRVLCRVFGIATDPRGKEANQKLWALAGELVASAPGRCSDLNQSLMELGALVCTPRQPQCGICPLRRMCAAFRLGKTAEWPALGARAAAIERSVNAYVVEKQGLYLVRQRPEGVVNGGLWEFPNFESAEAQKAAKQFRPLDKKPFLVVRHSITRHRITLEAWRAAVRGATQGCWLSPRELKRLPFTAAHGKILTAVLANAP